MKNAKANWTAGCPGLRVLTDFTAFVTARRSCRPFSNRIPQKVFRNTKSYAIRDTWDHNLVLSRLVSSRKVHFNRRARRYQRLRRWCAKKDSLIPGAPESSRLSSSDDFGPWSDAGLSDLGPLCALCELGGEIFGIILHRTENVEYRIRLRRKYRMMNLEEGLQERLMNSNTRGGRQNGDPNERVA